MPQPLDNITSRTTSGMVWLAGQSLLSRFTSFLAQWILMNWLLQPSDFGQIYLVYTITTLASQLTDPGIDVVLMQKQMRLPRWITPGFWMSLLCGLAGAVLMSLAGFVVCMIAQHEGNAAYGNPNIVWMTLILAAATPINSLALIPAVMLKSQLRLARVAGIGLVEIVVLRVLTVLCAALGFKAYSFVIPAPIVATVRLLILWRMVRPPVKWKLSLHRWPSLIASTRWMFGHRILSTLTGMGDNMTLGWMYGSDALVGLYAAAFNFATQIIRVLSENSIAALLPALSAINDAARMKQAAIRACRGLASIVIPICGLQIVLAGPGIRLLFASKWEAAIPLVQLLSAGLALLGSSYPLGLLLTAAGKFRLGFQSWLFNAAVFFALVVPLTWFWQAWGTALAVGLWSAFVAFSFAAFGFQSLDGAKVLIRCTIRPIIAVAIAAIPALVIVWLMPTSRWFNLLTLATAGPVMFLIYIAVLRQLDRETVTMLWQELSRVLRRFTRQPASAAV